jgi:1,3-beta-galactosyl-N-acetylhexosamine phosphorylase
MDECQQLYLMSKHNTAQDGWLAIPFLDGYYREQVVPDYIHDPKKWWEVMDRTADEVVPAEDWELDKRCHHVILNKAKAFHEYTVSFLVYAIWDPTQMYDHITNDLEDAPHEIPFDVRHPASGVFAKEHLIRWLQENPSTDVVRFTTFFYHFPLVFNQQAKEKFADWFGYGTTVSVEALETFEREYGYALRPEDLVDNGYYNSAFRVPTPHYLDYMDFIQRFVAKKAKELVDIVHTAGREAMMFFGDNWIGTEPYGKYFGEIGLDAVVGNVGSGVSLRMISEIPHVQYTEGRFQPCLFRNVMHEEKAPASELMHSWMMARRALMRRPVDRISCDENLSRSEGSQKDAEEIGKITEEFGRIYDQVKGQRPYCGLRVGVLNAWGSLRSWQAYMVAQELHCRQCYSYMGLMEALSGMAVEVTFLSFKDIAENGIPADIDVILNAGDAMTAFSGGEAWADPSLPAAIRRWVYDGGGFLGVGEPSAYHRGGRYFQLADVLGVDKELGFTLSVDKYFTTAAERHFITEDRTEPFDFGESKKSVYALDRNTEILEYSREAVHLSAHRYGAGCGVYMAGLPYSFENTRLLLRALYCAAGREAELKRWFAGNPGCEVHAYPEAGRYAVLNNTMQTQETVVYDGAGHTKTYTLEPGAIEWKTI